MTELFDKALSYLPGIGPRRATMLQAELQAHTYGDLLKQYPFRYEDRSHIQKIAQLLNQQDKPVQLIGQLNRFAYTHPKAPLRAIFSDETGQVELLWLHRKQWIVKQYPTGKRYLLYGKVQLRKQTCIFIHPELSLIDEKEPALQIQPVYRSTEPLRRIGLHSKGLAKLQEKLVPLLLPQMSDPFSESFRQAYSLMHKPEAVAQMHFPKTFLQAAAARRRLCFEELFFLQLHLLLRTAEKKQKQQGTLLKKTQLLHTFYEKHMPFVLTSAQQRVIREIHSDMCSGYQMNRLLQGDVGSGKTIVAWMSLLIALSNGLQVALMAPTEVLASQHAALLLRYAEPMGLSVAKLSGTTPKKARAALLATLASGQLQILVGTHALLEPDIRFAALGLVIIDEQHRFGVAQRAILSEKCSQPERPPHILVMTATPIPRTLALTQYGEMDVSLLDELPKGRKPIRTALRGTSSRKKVYTFIRTQLAAGHRGYIVYPLIEESEQLDLASLSESYATIQQIFKGYEIEQLHGRMPSEEKRYRMQRFNTGEAQLLVSTTVIEVGIDVPAANIMLIEHADRFGLAQLHQLRGRIGRGAAQAYCILMTEGRVSAEAKARLQALTETQDGFLLAEIDLQQRGPGNVLGTQQSGLWNFEVTDLTRDGDLLVEARSAAKKLLSQDPTLTKPEQQSIVKHLNTLRHQQKDWMSIG